MKRFLFIIPLKARKNAQDWQETCRLLNRTLMSIEGQNASNHHTYIVCNEPPELKANLDGTTVISTDIHVDGAYGLAAGRIDKQKKIYRALLEARSMNPKHVMIVDADDLVHRNLVSYVYSQPKYGGFVLSRGYVHYLGQPFVIRRFVFDRMSGSSAIYPYDSADFPENATEEDFPSYYMTKAAHLKPIDKIFKAMKIPYRHIPFFAAVYTRGHGQSLVDTARQEHTAATGRAKYESGKFFFLVHTMRRLRKLAARKRIDKELARQFPGLAIEVQPEAD